MSREEGGPKERQPASTPQKSARHFGNELSNLAAQSPLLKKWLQNPSSSMSGSSKERAQSPLQTLLTPGPGIKMSEQFSALEELLAGATAAAEETLVEGNKTYQKMQQEREKAETEARESKTALQQATLTHEKEQSDSDRKMTTVKNDLKRTQGTIKKLFKALNSTTNSGQPEEKALLQKIAAYQAKHAERAQLLEQATRRATQAEAAKKKITQRNAAKKKKIGEQVIKIEKQEKEIATLKAQLAEASTPKPEPEKLEETLTQVRADLESAKEATQRAVLTTKEQAIAISSLTSELRSERRYKVEQEQQNTRLLSKIQTLSTEKSTALQATLQATTGEERALNQVTQISSTATSRIENVTGQATGIIQESRTIISAAQTQQAEALKKTKNTGTIFLGAGVSGLALTTTVLCVIASQASSLSFAAGFSTMMSQSAAIPLISCLLAGGLLALIVLGAIKRKAKSSDIPSLSTTSILVETSELTTPPTTQQQQQQQQQEQEQEQEQNVIASAPS